MKWYIPREHGAWAMLIVPFIIGMFASEATSYHLLFFIGVLAFYFSSGPLLAYIRKPSIKKEILPPLFIYLAIGVVFISPVLYMFPTIIKIGLIIVPFFSLNIYFAKLKKERLFINDLLAIIGLSVLVLISYYIGIEKIDSRAIMLMLINITFFTASVFHVKTLIREKGNEKFLTASNIFHGITIFLGVIFSNLFAAVAFIVGAIKAWIMPKNRRYKPLEIGLIEIGNSVVFVLILALFY